MKLMFWLGFLGTFYAYVGYAMLLAAWRRVAPWPVRRDPTHRPAISLILPVHNEARHLEQRLTELRALDYPADRLELVVISDGSTDGSDAIVQAAAATDPRVRLLRIDDRKGKGNAVNAGCRVAKHDLFVFVDAGIALERDALANIVAPFADPAVGCVSGEDRIRGFSGEGLYGRYEMALRRGEAAVHSIVGASGSFYAMRREATPVFPEGQAPDFVAVLHTVSKGLRAVSEESATGWMGAVESNADEFRRKVRTLLRGMAALAAYASLLNPARAGVFSLFLWSHKVMRWLVPFFLIAMLVANAFLLSEPAYRWIGALQLLFYGTGSLALAGIGTRTKAGKFAGYFINVNAAIAVAWGQFVRGRRQEIWAPSQR